MCGYVVCVMCILHCYGEMCKRMLYRVLNRGERAPVFLFCFSRSQRRCFFFGSFICFFFVLLYCIAPSCSVVGRQGTVAARESYTKICGDTRVGSIHGIDVMILSSTFKLRCKNEKMQWGA